MRALLIVAVTAMAIPAEALACSPPPNWTPELQQRSDDAELLQANFIYRGVIEDPRAEYDLPEAWLTTMRIRRTKLLWGTGAPQVLSIRSFDGYGSMCERGNLATAMQFSGEYGWPQIDDGLGVTVIGRIGDIPSNMFILVDGAPDTVETLRRFETNLRNLDR